MIGPAAIGFVDGNWIQRQGHDDGSALRNLFLGQ